MQKEPSDEIWGVDNGKLKLFVLYFSCFALSGYAYSTYIVENWGYYGFSLAPDTVKLVEACAMLTIIVLMLPSKPKKPSDFLVHLHTVLPLLPMLVLYGFASRDRTYVYFVFFSFCILILLRGIPINFSQKSLFRIQTIMTLSLALSFLFILAIIALGGMKYLNFNIFDVYQYRRKASANLPSIFGYISPAISKVLLPFALLLAVRQRQYLMGVLAIIGSIMMYGLTGHKGPLFYPFFVLFLYYFSARPKMIIYLLLGYLSSIGIATVVSMFASGASIIPNLVLRRVLFVPANANFGYHDFFSTHPHTYLANSKVTFGLIEYPYDLPPPMVVGKYFWGGDDVSANTGWIGTGFMHFDYFGLLLFGAVLAMILRVIDSLAERQDKSLVAALITVPCFSLFNSTDLLTALLTHGLAFALLILWVMPSVEATEKVVNKPLFKSLPKREVSL
jgi:oligosaccharide repeat unit polymerase